jgi:hypothetical protein
VVHSTAAAAFALRSKLIQEHCDSRAALPQVVVHDLEVQVAIRSPRPQQGRTKRSRPDIGFHYVSDVVTPEEAHILLSEVRLYNQKFGLAVSDSHFIQRDSRPLRPLAQIAPSLLAKIAACARVSTSEVSDHANFNYYPEDKQGEREHDRDRDHGFAPHQDPLFYDEKIAILSLGSPTTIRFQHWVTLDCFDVEVEPNSCYIMEGLCRYEYTHGTAERAESGARLSFVLGIKSQGSQLVHSPAQVWGQSETRAEVDRFVSEALGKETRLNLLQYVEFIRFMAATNRLPREDYVVLKPELDRLGRMCVRDFHYKSC